MRSALDVLRSVVVIQCDVRAVPRILHTLAARVVRDSASCRDFVDSAVNLAANIRLLGNDMAAASRLLEAGQSDAGPSLTCAVLVLMHADFDEDASLLQSSGHLSMTSVAAKTDTSDGWD